MYQNRQIASFYRAAYLYTNFPNICLYMCVRVCVCGSEHVNHFATVIRITFSNSGIYLCTNQNHLNLTFVVLVAVTPRQQTKMSHFTKYVSVQTHLHTCVCAWLHILVSMCVLIQVNDRYELAF